MQSNGEDEQPGEEGDVGDKEALEDECLNEEAEGENEQEYDVDRAENDATTKEVAVVE